MVRIPNSGGATKKPLPDVWATYGNPVTFAAGFEVKVTKDKVKYIEEKKFCKRGALPLLAVKFIRRGWRISAPEDLQRTEKGAYKFRLEDGGSLDWLKPGGE